MNYGQKWCRLWWAGMLFIVGCGTGGKNPAGLTVTNITVETDDVGYIWPDYRVRFKFDFTNVPKGSPYRFTAKSPPPGNVARPGSYSGTTGPGVNGSKEYVETGELVTRDSVLASWEAGDIITLELKPKTENGTSTWQVMGSTPWDDSAAQ